MLSAARMHVVRHQAPGPHLDAGRAAMGGEQVAIKRIVAVTKEGLRAAIAALGHMVRMTGNDDTGETSHAAWCARGCACQLSALSP